MQGSSSHDRGRPVRVLNLLPDPRVGGPQRRVALLANEIRPLGYETIAVTPSGPAVDFFTQSGIEAVAFDFPRPRRANRLTSALRFVGGLPVDAWRLAAVIRATKADILHCNGMLTLVGPFAGRLAGTPMVWQLNDTQIPRPVCRAVLATCGPLADCIAVSARAVARHALEADTPYDVLYPPVDLARCPQSVGGEGRARLLDSLGLAPSIPTVLTIGHINAVKGHRYLLDGLALLRAAGRTVQLIVVGERVDAAVARDVEAGVERHGLEASVRFVGGAEDIAPFLAAADVFVLPSLSEGMPMALLEAMGAGLPVVSTEVGGVAEAVRHGVDGLLTVPRNAAALAAQIGRILDDRGVAQDMGRHAMEVVSARFSTQACGLALATVYEKLARAARERRHWAFAIS